MNWHDYLLVLSGVVSSRLYDWAKPYVQDKLKYTYSWQCRSCQFKVRSSDELTLDRVQKIHAESH